MHETCLIIIHDSSMRPSPESKPGTFGSADECSTTKLTLHLNRRLPDLFKQMYYYHSNYEVEATTERRAVLGTGDGLFYGVATDLG